MPKLNCCRQADLEPYGAEIFKIMEQQLKWLLLTQWDHFSVKSYPENQFDKLVPVSF